MSLYDNPPHSVSVYAPAGSTRDTGGGVKLNWTLVQSGVDCSIATASASEIATYARKQIIVSHRVGILSELLDADLKPGMKLQADDSESYFLVRGFTSPNRQYGGIPPLTYVYCMEILPGR